MFRRLHDFLYLPMRFSDRLHDRRERWSAPGEPHPVAKLSGKLEGRAFMVEHGFKVPEEISVYPSIDAVPDFSELPDRFVLKPARGYSARNVFVMSGGVNLLDGKAYDRNAIVEAVKASFSSGQTGPKFLIEELLVNWDGKDGIPFDYKFYTFGDKIAFIHAIERNSGRDIKANRHWFLKEDWTHLGIRIQKVQDPQTDPLPKPDCFEELLDTVKRVGRTLNMFMRIDMYATTRGAVFGEFTPTPHGGRGYTPEADRWLGYQWHGLEGADGEVNPRARRTLPSFISKGAAR